MSEMIAKKVLECSSKGDKRFSAFYAKVEVFGVFQSIEEHYQLAKLYEGINGLVHAKDWKEAKSWQKEGKFPVRMMINGIEFPVSYLSSYYKLLWVKYLDANNSLVEFAKDFDDFTDMFRGKQTLNCQADVIKQYVKEGRSSLLSECRNFIRLMNKTSYVMETSGDLLLCQEDILGHQVNAQGVMGAGLALSISKKYPNVFEEYKLNCQIYQRKRSLMGQCQIVETEDGKYVANLFGQFRYGKGEQFTEYAYLEEALHQLKDYAKLHQLTVGIPFQLGCGHAGGEWKIVRDIIERVFNDYHVTIYQLNE